MMIKLTPHGTIKSGIILVIITAVSGVSAEASTLNGLLAHRAVYEIELEGASDRSGISTMNGRIVYQITGSACEGFAVSFRFVTRIDTGRKSFVTDPARFQTAHRSQALLLRGEATKDRPAPRIAMTVTDSVSSQAAKRSWKASQMWNAGACAFYYRSYNQ